jgi:hypothetical protein
MRAVFCGVSPSQGVWRYLNAKVSMLARHSPRISVPVRPSHHHLHSPEARQIASRITAKNHIDLDCSTSGSGRLKRDPLDQLQRVPLAGYRDSAKTLFRQAKSQEDPEVIRVSQWAEIRPDAFRRGGSEEGHRPAAGSGRQDRPPGGRRGSGAPPATAAAARPRLDPWRDQIESWLKAEPKLTAVRSRVILSHPEPGMLSQLFSGSLSHLVSG